MVEKTGPPTVILFIFLAILPTLTTAGHAASMNVGVSTDRLTLDYRLMFQTNTTMTMPIMKVLVQASNSSASIAAITAPFNKAIQKLVPGASLDPSTLEFSART